MADHGPAETALHPFVTSAEYAVLERTRWQRFVAALYPSSILKTPEEIEGFAGGYIRNETVITLDWKDRIRMLFSGRIIALVSLKTENDAGSVITQAVVFVGPPRSWL